jgi:hypothetical protein
VTRLRAASRELRARSGGTGARAPRRTARRVRLAAFFCVPLALLAAARIARTGTLVLYGVSEAVFQLSAQFPVPVRPYRSAGFEQSVATLPEGVLVRLVSRPGSVRLDAPHPMRGDEAGFLGPLEPIDEEARAEALRLSSSSTRRRQVVEGVLDWLSERLQYHASDGEPQAPLDVLSRGGGNCVGWTRTAVAMLRIAGVPARSVHGFRLELEGADIRGGTFHRLLEVHYPGAGWAASDVGRTKNFLPADTIVLAVEGEELPESGWMVEAAPSVPFYRHIGYQGGQSALLPLDEQRWPERTQYAAWSPDRGQSRGLIFGELVGEAPVLQLYAESARGRLSAIRAGGLFAFPGLLPGSYTVFLDTAGGSYRYGPWRLEAHEALRLRLDPAGADRDEVR